jgi:hypothetical protein
MNRKEHLTRTLNQILEAQVQTKAALVVLDGCHRQSRPREMSTAEFQPVTDDFDFQPVTTRRSRKKGGRRVK